MDAKELYEKETGEKSPNNQIAYHDWYIGYVKWLEQKVEESHSASDAAERSEQSPTREEIDEVWESMRNVGLDKPLVMESQDSERMIANKIADYWYKEIHGQAAPIFSKQKLRDFVETELRKLHISNISRVIKKWETVLKQDNGKDIVYSRDVLLEMLTDMRESKFGESNIE